MGNPTPISIIDLNSSVKGKVTNSYLNYGFANLV